jgi:hypothetical protein
MARVALEGLEMSITSSVHVTAVGTAARAATVRAVRERSNAGTRPHHRRPITPSHAPAYRPRHLAQTGI